MFVPVYVCASIYFYVCVCACLCRQVEHDGKHANTDVNH